METRTHRRRFQFSLRAFLIAALLLGGGGGWLARRYWPTERAPDGKIIWVNQRDKKVWIRFDDRRLPKQGTAFEVYDGDRAITDWTEHKAVISIGKKLGLDLVEARIERGEIADPVVGNDSIYLRGWRAQRFK
jgi:hypothetical protein